MTFSRQSTQRLNLCTRALTTLKMQPRPFLDPVLVRDHASAMQRSAPSLTDVEQIVQAICNGGAFLNSLFIVLTDMLSPSSLVTGRYGISAVDLSSQAGNTL